MRCAAPLALLIGLTAFAAPAMAAAPAPPKPAALRGLQSAKPAATTPAKPPPAPIPTPIDPLASRIPADTGQCRLGCARAYYFCLADDAGDACSSTWVSCLSGCSRATDAP